MAELDTYLVALPGGRLDDVVVRLGELGLVGWAIDGDALGHRGYVLALVAGDTDGALWVVRDDEWSDLSEQALLDELHRRWRGSVVDPETLGGADLVMPSMASPRLGSAMVAVLPREDLMLPVVAASAKVTLEQADAGGAYVVGVADGSQLPDDFLDVVAGNVRGTAIVLWRRGAYLGLHVSHRGELRLVHWWTPAWTPVGSAGHQDLRDEFGSPVGDAVVLADLLGRPHDVDALRTLLRLPAQSPAEVVAGLGLPVEVASVLSGARRVVTLPGGTAVEPRGMWSAVRAAMAPSEHDPAWVRWIDDGRRELRPSYVVPEVVGTAIGIALLAVEGGVSGVLGVLGLVSVVTSLVMLPLRYWLRQRRRRAAA